jgi:hypothetical protein
LVKSATVAKPAKRIEPTTIVLLVVLTGMVRVVLLVLDAALLLLLLPSLLPSLLPLLALVIIRRRAALDFSIGDAPAWNFTASSPIVHALTQSCSPPGGSPFKEQEKGMRSAADVPAGGQHGSQSPNASSSWLLKSKLQNEPDLQLFNAEQVFFASICSASR